MPLLDAFPGLDAIVSAAQLHRLGWVIVHSLWQAAAVAAVLAVGLRLLPRRSVFALQARYALATLALAALPIACVATYALVAPPVAAYPTASPPTTMPVASAPRRMVVVPAAIAERRIDGATALQQSAAQVPVDIRAAFVALAQQTATAISPWLPCCAALWLAGVTAAAGRLGVGWWLTRRLVAQAIAPADAHWQARLDRWKSVLGIAGPIRLLASARIDVPVVVGWLEPVVLWPLAALTGMPPDQIDAILAHELAHIRRHDVFVNLLQSCIETLFFHHPAAWWISAQVRAEREHCADDLAIRGLEHARAGSTHSYAMALISLEERRRRTALAVAADGGSLVDRVGRLAGIEPAAGHPARLAAATLVLATVIASAATVAATPRPALAADAKAGKLPKDTNRIKSLTPEQARKLAAEFAGKVGEIEIKGHGKVKLPGCLPLNGLQSLDAETAKALAEFKGQQLHLNGLTTLSDDAAKALAECKGLQLYLDGLTTLTADAAKALAEFKGHGLSLGGLTTLSDDATKALAESKGGWLGLNGLTTLSDDAAQALAAFKGKYLYLHGLTTLSDDAAKALVKFLAESEGRSLSLGRLGQAQPLTPETARLVCACAKTDFGASLSGLTALDTPDAAEIAKILGTATSRLDLPNLKKISADAAKALAESKGDSLLLNGLTTLSAETAKALAEFQGQHLSLNGLAALSADAAKALAECKGQGLYLKGLTTLSADAAKALAEFKGQYLHLDGLTTLSADAAKALAECKGQQLILNGLTTLSAEAAEALAKFQGRDLYFNGLASLSADAAKALAEYKGQGLSLNGLPTLDADTATALAECKSQHLSLDGLTTLSADAAKALAEFKGQHLSLYGLTTLDADAAKALAEFKGQSLFLETLMSRLGKAEPLTPETARLVCACAKAGSVYGSAVSLSGLTALDTPDAVEIAKILATVTGRLDLPNLRRISADAAQALAEFKGQELSLENFMSRLEQAKSLTPATAWLVCACAKPGSAVSLSGLIALDTPNAVEIAKVLATAKGGLDLPNLKKISADAATALAEFKGSYLYLDGLTTLSADAAKAFTEFKGEELCLNGLTTLSADAASALAEFKGQSLFLETLMSRLGQAEPLTLETARLVCACAQSGSAVTLSGLTAIDTPDAVEIAKILATAKGQLRFPQLKRISPKTLTALIEKTDVLIPPIESLELIPEPDGGPTEDFVTPEGFEERQKQLELQIQCPDRSRQPELPQGSTD